jgi:hypothetical protein
MDRKCIYCETQIDIKKHGLTKFCSAVCRNKYYYQNRIIKNIADQNIVLLNKDLPNNEAIEEKKEEKIGIVRQADLPVHAGTGNDDSFIYSLIEEKFDAKNECNLYKLKCEKLEEEKRRLEQELFDANSELDSLDDSDQTSPFSFLSGLPENVIAGVSKAAFENEHIRNLISSFIPAKK